MGLLYYIIDTRMDAWSEVNLNVPEYPGHRSIVHWVDWKQTISAIVTIMNHSYLLEEEKIRWLYLVAHGDSGRLELGEGLDAGTARYLSDLRKHFEDGSQILVHGCGAASDSSILAGENSDGSRVHIPGTYRGGTMGHGYLFLKAIADATGVPVTGAVNAQKPELLFLVRRSDCHSLAKRRLSNGS